MYGGNPNQNSQPDNTSKTYKKVVSPINHTRSATAITSNSRFNQASAQSSFCSIKLLLKAPEEVREASPMQNQVSIKMQQHRACV
jgi:hypothetical protein